MIRENNDYFDGDSWIFGNIQCLHMTGRMAYTPSHTNICKFVKFQLTFSQLIIFNIKYAETL